MSAYIKLTTLEYPRYQGDIRLEHPEIGDEFVCPDTYAYVEDSVIPEFNEALQFLFETAPIQVDGVWQQTWFVRDKTEEELELCKFVKEKYITNKNLNVQGSAPDVIG